MPANLEVMAYAGQAPWHKLGNKVDPNVSVDRMLIEAGLDWEVKLRPVLFRPFMDTETDVSKLTEAEKTTRKQLYRDEGHRVMFRDNDLKVLDIVGPNYEPVQNTEVMEFFREYVETGSMQLETAGSLEDGKVIWAMAKMTESFELVGGDAVQPYLFLANPHKYGQGYIIKFTSVRIVCMNTYMQALQDAGSSLKLWHNRKFDVRARDEAKLRLGIAGDRLRAFHEDADELTRTKIKSQQVAIDIVARHFNPSKVGEPLTKQSITVKRVIQLYDGAGLGAELASARGTAWGVFNAVTQYLDHEYGKTADSRMTNAWLGSGDVKKRRVMGDLLSLTA